MSHNNSHIIDFSNVPNQADTQKIVIFAEASNTSVVWDWPGNEGHPTDPNYNPSFGNAARDWVKMNPLIVQSDGSYKPLEVKYLVAYGKNEMIDEFNKLKKSGFVDGDTNLIVMGHAGGTFAGEDPGVWQDVITDTGFRNEFSEVAYGACSQGESPTVCMDLSRSFGSKTVVHAQVGQTWGVADTPAHFIDRWRKDPKLGGPDFVSRHPIPVNQFMPDPTGKAAEVKHWTEQLFTVGSGRVTFPGGYKNPVVVSGGSEDYSLPSSYSLEEANAFIGGRQDPQALQEYTTDVQSFMTEYEETAGPGPDMPEYADFPGMYQTKNRAALKVAVYHNLAKEWWAETHNGDALPDDKQKMEYYGTGLTSDFNSQESDEFYDWIYDKEQIMEESGVLTVEEHDATGASWRHYQDMIEYEIDILEEVEENRQWTSEELAAGEAYSQAWDEWTTVGSEYREKYDQAFIESGITAPPYIGGEHLLDSEDDIPFTFDEFSTDPMKSVDVMAGGANYEDLDIKNRVYMLKDLAAGGNETAISAFSDAMFKIDEIDPALYDNSSLIYGYMADIEALRLYAESGEGLQYRAE